MHVYRLGNMTLLETRLNRDLGQADFGTKRTMYEQSGFGITREIGQLVAPEDRWTTGLIDSRQAQMARLAKSLWRSQQIERGHVAPAP